MTWWLAALAIYCALAAIVCLIQLGRDIAKGKGGIDMDVVVIAVVLSPVLV